jgi:hypothetical protein
VGLGAQEGLMGFFRSLGACNALIEAISAAAHGVQKADSGEMRFEEAVEDYRQNKAVRDWKAHELAPAEEERLLAGLHEHLASRAYPAGPAGEGARAHDELLRGAIQANQRKALAQAADAFDSSKLLARVHQPYAVGSGQARGRRG